MANKRIPKLHRHISGNFFIIYRRKRTYFGKDPVMAKLAYDDWFKNVYAPDQAIRSDLKKKTPKTIMFPWNLPAELAWLADDLREYVAWRYPPCVYFLLRDDTVVYIGSTVDLPNRVRQQIQEGKEFDRVLWMPVEKTRFRKLEARFIAMLKPTDNDRGKKGVTIERDVAQILMPKSAK